MRRLVRVFCASLLAGICCTPLPSVAQGIITTIAGNGTSSFSGDGGPATSAGLSGPDSVVVDSAGNLYIADWDNNRIRKVDATGTISTIAGNGSPVSSGDGGFATDAGLRYPRGVAIDSAGSIYASEWPGHRIRKVTPVGAIATIAGTGQPGFSGDGGPATEAQLNFPRGLAVDSVGNLYIADTVNNRIRKVTPAGTISTVAGNGEGGFSGDGGLATNAQLFQPGAVAVDQGGDLYIAESFVQSYYGPPAPGNHRIRKVTPDGIITTVAGNGVDGFSATADPPPVPAYAFPKVLPSISRAIFTSPTRAITASAGWT
jgi:NHL repeat